MKHHFESEKTRMSIEWQTQVSWNKHGGDPEESNEIWATGRENKDWLLIDGLRHNWGNEIIMI